MTSRLEKITRSRNRPIPSVAACRSPVSMAPQAAITRISAARSKRVVSRLIVLIGALVSNRSGAPTRARRREYSPVTTAPRCAREPCGVERRDGSASRAVRLHHEHADDAKIVVVIPVHCTRAPSPPALGGTSPQPRIVGLVEIAERPELPLDAGSLRSLDRGSRGGGDCHDHWAAVRRGVRDDAR